MAEEEEARDALQSKRLTVSKPESNKNYYYTVLYCTVLFNKESGKCALFYHHNSFGFLGRVSSFVLSSLQYSSDLILILCTYMVN